MGDSLGGGGGRLGVVTVGSSSLSTSGAGSAESGASSTMCVSTSSNYQVVHV